MNTITHDSIKKLIWKAAAVSVILLLCVFAAKALKRQSLIANAETKRNLKCVSICVAEDDTLWGIASEYYSDEYGGVSNLVNEIRNINKMSSDRIDVGNYIIVPYYE
ncbi:MAG: LysM peptidoglycan-binding domain-containing protein [Lachnospiraceae bacterium]|nr:LysM peptidoglycan-binding domain-containing protein [Lachnospiraceae bacterium]